jgi:sugar transferase (PEP-CTERM/EpsH1 system associated)
MAQYLPFVPASCRVADFHDVDSEKWRQFAQHARAPLRWMYAIEAHRLRQFETTVGAGVDWVLFVSEPEAALFRSFTMDRIPARVVSNGVDTTFFHPVSAPAAGQRTNILFTGTLDYRPNIDAVQFFVRDVLPRVRAEIATAQFTAAGHRPVRRLLRSVRSAGDCVKIAGSVPDIRPYFAAAHVYVAPMRLGRGIQNKILEAMAMGVPVVATPLAVEGLAVDDGIHVLVAKGPEQFAAAVVALLRDADRCRELVENALRLVQRQYRSELTVQGIDAFLPEAFVPAAHSRP